MNTLGRKLSCGAAFQLVGDGFDSLVVTPYHEVDMVLQDGAGKDGQPRGLDVLCEAADNCAGLEAGEFNGGVFQGGFSGAAEGGVVGSVGKRLALVGFGGAAEAEEFPGADEI
jgi:hypothetical protein